MDKVIKADLFRYYGKTGNFEFFKTLRVPGFRYSYFFRLAQKHKRKSFLGLMIYVYLKKLGYRYGFQIPPQTKIGEGLFIGHFGTLIINEGSIIGKNCNLSPGVTIGQSNRGVRKGCPVIGNNVWIGTNSVIVGNIVIGDNVLIAPSTYLNIDVPNDSIVIGNPAKIIYNKQATQDYIQNTI